MAQIVVNEISQNYTWSIGNNSYATVAMPITSCWGPGYFDPETYYGDSKSECEDPHEMMLEHTSWSRFPATQRGLESFISTYRGPSSVYRRAHDYSYQMALTLLSSGYDVLVCRLCPGNRAQGLFNSSPSGKITFLAKYPGTFGNNLQISIKKNKFYDSVNKVHKIYWSIITHIVDSSGIKTSAENLSCVFNAENSTDSVLHWSELESNFWVMSVDGDVDEGTPGDIESLNAVTPPTSEDDQGSSSTLLSGGTDIQPLIKNIDDAKSKFKASASSRYEWAKIYNTGYSSGDDYDKYPNVFDDSDFSDKVDVDKLHILTYREWLFTHLVAYPIGKEDESDLVYEGVFDLLKDKLAYNPNRVIASGWDDQNYLEITDDFSIISGYVSPGQQCKTCKLPPSPLHLKLMDVAYYSRCATALIDIPHVVDRKFVHIEDETDLEREGYVQKLARVVPYNADLDVNGTLFHTHSALFAPWGQYTYVGTGKMNVASPSFLALMIQRAQILNQANQYEWALPTNRKHNLRIGKLDYTVTKKILDKWQKLDGASVNVITNIPDLGTNLWGNSTLFEVPPATYQALANLSTRYLVNAVEDVVYRCGIGITFQYNNSQAYNKFYAGVSPLLDTMKNVGAIEGYRIQMSADINSLDQVNANTVIGKIWLLVNGVVNDIYVDLIALPAGAGIDLNALS